MIKAASEHIVFRTDIDKYRHISLGEPLDYRHIFVYAVHHSLERKNHRANLVILVACQHLFIELDLIRTLRKPVRPVGYSDNRTGNLFGRAIAIECRNQKTHQSAKDANYNQGKNRTLQFFRGFVRNLLILA